MKTSFVFQGRQEPRGRAERLGLLAPAPAHQQAANHRRRDEQPIGRVRHRAHRGSGLQRHQRLLESAPEAGLHFPGHSVLVDGFLPAEGRQRAAHAPAD